MSSEVTNESVEVVQPPNFSVNLPDFAGPIDLLIFLIRKRELDIAYISVSAIASDFLDWLHKIDFLDLDSAGDFILLAATLLQFKAGNLLIAKEPEFSEAEQTIFERQGSPEDLLALREAIHRLADLEAKQMNLFDRGIVQVQGVTEEITDEMMSDVSAVDLALVFRDIIYNLPKEATHVVQTISYTLEGQISFIQSIFEDKVRIAFHTLAEQLVSRLAVIMTFLAILEMIRKNEVRVVQNEPFGKLFILKTN